MENINLPNIFICDEDGKEGANKEGLSYVFITADKREGKFLHARN
jgi:hypothetical protein